MKMNNRAFACVQVVAAVAGLALAASWAMADTGTGDCCFTKDCGEAGSITVCTGSACVLPKVCTGIGGCTPIVWASASCRTLPTIP